MSGRRHTLGKRAYVNAYRGFESRPLRQEQPRLNFGENTMQYVFINGVAGIVAMRQKEPKSYANNYNVRANGRFAKLQ